MSGHSRICYHGVPRVIENSFNRIQYNELIKNQKDLINDEKIENLDIHALNYLEENRLNLNFRQVFI